MKFGNTENREIFEVNLIYFILENISRTYKNSISHFEYLINDYSLNGYIFNIYYSLMKMVSELLSNIGVGDDIIPDMADYFSSVYLIDVINVEEFDSICDKIWNYS